MTIYEFILAAADEADLPANCQKCGDLSGDPATCPVCGGPVKPIHRRKKAGDIIAVMPQGHPWGRKEIDEYLIVPMDVPDTMDRLDDAKLEKMNRAQLVKFAKDFDLQGQVVGQMNIPGKYGKTWWEHVGFESELRQMVKKAIPRSEHDRLRNRLERPYLEHDMEDGEDFEIYMPPEKQPEPKEGEEPQPEPGAEKPAGIVIDGKAYKQPVKLRATGKAKAKRGDDYMEAPRQIGKRRFRIDFAELAAAAPVRIDAEKVRDKACIYQPFLSAERLVRPFNGAARGTSHAKVSAKVLTKALRDATRGRKGSYLLNVEDVDCGDDPTAEASVKWEADDKSLIHYRHGGKASPKGRREVPKDDK